MGFPSVEALHQEQGKTGTAYQPTSRCTSRACLYAVDTSYIIKHLKMIKDVGITSKKRERTR